MNADKQILLAHMENNILVFFVQFILFCGIELIHSTRAVTVASGYSIRHRVVFYSDCCELFARICSLKNCMFEFLPNSCKNVHV